MAYLKPQSPLYHKDSDSYFYPLTTNDQVLINDKRLNDYSIISTTKLYYTLFADKWVLVNNQYIQSIYVDGLNESYTVDIKLIYTEILEKDLLISKNAPYIQYAKQDDDKITFYCLKNKPVVDIPIEVEVHL